MRQKRTIFLSSGRGSFSQKHVNLLFDPFLVVRSISVARLLIYENAKKKRHVNKRTKLGCKALTSNPSIGQRNRKAGKCRR